MPMSRRMGYIQDILQISCIPLHLHDVVKTFRSGRSLYARNPANPLRLTWEASQITWSLKRPQILKTWDLRKDVSLKLKFKSIPVKTRRFRMAVGTKGSGRTSAVFHHWGAPWRDLILGRRQHVHDHILLTASTCKTQCESEQRSVEWWDRTWREVKGLSPPSGHQVSETDVDDADH